MQEIQIAVKFIDNGKEYQNLMKLDPLMNGPATTIEALDALIREAASQAARPIFEAAADHS